MTETFALYLKHGTGTAEFRVAIEGCPLEFCTAHEMRASLSVGTLNGIKRAGGLSRDGLSYQESVYLPGAEHRASVGSVLIEDTDETSVAWNLRAASSVFSKVAEDVGYLAATVSSTDTTWTLLSTSGLSVGQVVHLDTEAVRIETIPDSTTITVTRGMWRTTAQAHFVAVSDIAGDRTQLCALYDAPPTYRRRRVWIYGHGPDELGATDEGTLIARGIVGSAPTLQDAMAWSFPVSPLTALFDCDVGPRDGAAVITGIYYPGASPFRFTVYRRTGDSVTDEVGDTVTIYLAGRWRSQDAFCVALTEAINARLQGDLGWTETFSARPSGSGWELYVRTAATSQKHIACWGGSVIDGMFTGALHIPTAGVSLSVSTVSADTEYRCSWSSGEGLPPEAGWQPPPEGVRGVPRSQSFAHSLPPGTAADIAAYPWHRVYLAASSGVGVGDTIRLTQPDTGTQEYAWEATVSAVDATTGAVDWDPDTMVRIGDADPGSPSSTWTVITPSSLPSVTLVRDLGIGHVGDMLLALALDAPELANAGTVPFILTTDFDDFGVIHERVREAAAGAPWLLARRYSYATAVSFAALLKHELRLLGAYFATTADGAITLRTLTPRVEIDATIDESDLLTDKRFGDLVVEPDGVLTGLEVHHGYDSLEDKHAEATTQIVALGAVAAQRTYLALEVAPKSRPLGPEPTYEELVAHLYGVVSLWSRLRFQVSVDVTAQHHDTLIGEAVYCTLPQLPFNGERSIDGGGGGIIATRGTVVGRSWRFADNAVALTILFDALSMEGYTPAGRIVSQSGSGTSWTVTLSEVEYGPGGDTVDADFFAAGYKVRVYEWDTDAPTMLSGEVVSVSGNDVELEFASTWTPGSSTWNLGFDKSTTAGLASAQLTHAYIAHSDLRVHLASGTRRPARFTP